LFEFLLHDDLLSDGRSAPHCIEYAKLILWGQARPGEDFDADVEEHMRWIYDRAVERAAQYGIPGVTYQLTQGVVKVRSEP
jgi:ubiquitin-activating enzyme E1 C